MAESTKKKTAAKRASDLSDEVLKRIEARQLAAIEAIRKLVDRLDDATPDLVDDPSARKKVVGAIGDYSSSSPRQRTSTCAAPCAARAGW